MSKLTIGLRPGEKATIIIPGMAPVEVVCVWKERDGKRRATVQIAAPRAYLLERSGQPSD